LRRILLIDDTPEIAELLTFALRDRGYEVFASGYTSAINELVLEQRAGYRRCTGWISPQRLANLTAAADQAIEVSEVSLDLGAQAFISGERAGQFYTPAKSPNPNFRRRAKALSN
jgi:CheY-like chemotaxis protein